MSRRKGGSESTDSGMYLRNGQAVQLVRYFSVDGISQHELVSGTLLSKTSSDWLISGKGNARTLSRQEWHPCST